MEGLMHAMQELLFDSDGKDEWWVLARLGPLPIQRQRWIAGFHPESRIRSIAFNQSGVTIGRRTFISIGLVVLDDYKGIVTIGERCSIGNYVSIMAATSPNDSILGNHPELQGAIKTEPVTIGNDCWIGTGSIIMPGVTIADKAVVGAGAVVTKDVAERQVVHGVPGRVARTLP